VDDIDKWLNDLGLGRYADTFARNEIDIGSLQLLSDQDLRAMRVPLGPRKRILAAIESLTTLNAQEAAPAESEDPSTAPAERRQLTILFCDLVASTEYADRMDPEDFRRLIQMYLKRCSAVVKRHNGQVVSYVGDAVMALFGYPAAEEDDAERALHAAFDMLEVVTGMGTARGLPLQVRVGVASGLVVVGRLPGAPTGVSTVAFGHVNHLAARLQTLAQPHTILTDEATYRATVGAFTFADSGRHTLKGFAEPVQVWQVREVRALESRFAKRTLLSELIGRDREVQLLVQRWDRVVSERRDQAAVISGEPGIGKSRLLHEVQRRVPPCTRLLFQCATAFSNSTLYPFLTELKRHGGIRDEDFAQTKLQKVETIISVSEVATATSLPIFASLLSIPSEGLYSPSEMNPARQRNITRLVLLDWIGHFARIRPILIFIEDEQ
jgi:class 3 adenylate cyclase